MCVYVCVCVCTHISPLTPSYTSSSLHPPTRILTTHTFLHILIPHTLPLASLPLTSSHFPSHTLTVCVCALTSHHSHLPTHPHPSHPPTRILTTHILTTHTLTPYRAAGTGGDHWSIWDTFPWREANGSGLWTGMILLSCD